MSKENKERCFWYYYSRRHKDDHLKDIPNVGISVKAEDLPEYADIDLSQKTMPNCQTCNGYKSKNECQSYLPKP